jgi:hypothetical protein
VPIVPTEAINGRLEHLRGSALGFRNLTHYIARSLLEAGGFRLRLHPSVAGGTFTGMAAKVKEQNLAVFGESGSGKTVLLSSFYGASQESSFLAESLYKVLADDTRAGEIQLPAPTPRSARRRRADGGPQE